MVVGVVVGPGHRHDETSALVVRSLPWLGLRISSPGAPGKKQKTRRPAAPFEQHHAERNSNGGFFARIIAEAIHPASRSSEEITNTFGQVRWARAQNSFRGRLVEHVVLRLHQDRADEAPPSVVVHGDPPWPSLNEAHGESFMEALVGGIEPGDRRQHQDESPRWCREASPSFISESLGERPEADWAPPQRIGEGQRRQQRPGRSRPPCRPGLEG